MSDFAPSRLEMRNLFGTVRSRRHVNCTPDRNRNNSENDQKNNNSKDKEFLVNTELTHSISGFPKSKEKIQNKRSLTCINCNHIDPVLDSFFAI